MYGMNATTALWLAKAPAVNLSPRSAGSFFSYFDSSAIGEMLARITVEGSTNCFGGGGYPMAIVAGHNGVIALRSQAPSYMGNDPATAIAVALKRASGAGAERIVDPDKTSTPSCAPEAYGGTLQDGTKPNPVIGKFPALGRIMSNRGFTLS